MHEKQRFQELQRAGKWRHYLADRRPLRERRYLRRRKQYRAPRDPDEPAIGTPFMQMKVTPLCRHPSSIHDDDR